MRKRWGPRPGVIIGMTAALEAAETMKRVVLVGQRSFLRRMHQGGQGRARRAQRQGGQTQRPYLPYRITRPPRMTSTRPFRHPERGACQGRSEAEAIDPEMRKETIDFPYGAAIRATG